MFLWILECSFRKGRERGLVVVGGEAQPWGGSRNGADDAVRAVEERALEAVEGSRESGLEEKPGQRSGDSSRTWQVRGS